MWTKEQDQYLLDNYASVYAKDIAKVLGKTLSVVRTRINQLGLANKQQGINFDWTQEQLSFIKDNIETIAIKEVMERFGTTRAVAGGKVREIKKEMGLYNSTCPVCNKDFQDIKGCTRHIITTKTQKHQAFVKKQEQLATEWFKAGKKQKDLIEYEDFVFGKDWLRAFSKEAFDKDWIHNKEERLRKFVCKQCDKEFNAYAHSQRKSPKYCSWKCFEADSAKIEYECVTCGKKFKAHLKSDKTERCYCSNKCQSQQENAAETKALNIIDNILGEKALRNKRYKWMKSPKGRPLEIDGYYPKANIAIEYQGKQHYSTSTLFKHDLDYRQQLDDIKRTAIKAKGIKLIEIKYDEPLIREHLKNRVV